jgi:uncharacterized Fe-S cluster-containing radical SAM superfamily protein
VSPRRLWIPSAPICEICGCNFLCNSCWDFHP